MFSNLLAEPRFCVGATLASSFARMSEKSEGRLGSWILPNKGLAWISVEHCGCPLSAGQFISLALDLCVEIGYGLPIEVVLNRNARRKGR